MNLRSALRKCLPFVMFLFLFPAVSYGNDGNAGTVNLFVIHTGNVKGRIVPCPS